ncbi:hypothetical protein DBA29_26415 [Xenophilus aerolatus]|nr:hypothetical protein [Xenophilus aerolatus]
MLRLTDYPPMLLEERPFAFGAAGWLYEIKFDGYRLMAVVDGGRVELRTRGAANASAWFPEVVDGLAGLKGGPSVFDGEICVLDDAGRSDFDRLHARARRRRWYDGADPVVYCIFDVLVADEHGGTGGGWRRLQCVGGGRGGPKHRLIGMDDQTSGDVLELCLARSDGQFLGVVVAVAGDAERLGQRLGSDNGPRRPQAGGAIRCTRQMDAGDTAGVSGQQSLRALAASDGWVLFNDVVPPSLRHGQRTVRPTAGAVREGFSPRLAVALDDDLEMPCMAADAIHVGGSAW